MPADFSEWAKEAVAGIRDSPTRGVLTAAFGAYLGLWHTATTRLHPGVNVYDRDWDALVVLDACRVDALREVADEYHFLGEVDSIQSVGSSSHEWMAHTFTEQQLMEIKRTAYTSPNGFSELCFVNHDYPPRRAVPFGSFDWDVVSAADFGLLDINWNQGHDPALGIVPPRYMTDRAIHIGRETDFKRLIVHYYQPHKPYLAGAIRENREPTAVESDPWGAIRRGEASREEVWELYLANLRLVLDEVALLVQNLDAETVAVTADHGDAFGEFGAYGHPEGFPHPATRRVPWVETTATDKETYEPREIEDVGYGDHVNELAGQRSTDSEVLDRLAELGYH